MKQPYWFTRKLYGWGWQPASWQGRVVLLVFVLLEVGNAFRLDLIAQTQGAFPTAFVLQSLGLVVLLILVCLRTGEKPRWQWGKRIEDDEDVNEPR